MLLSPDSILRCLGKAVAPRKGSGSQQCEEAWYSVYSVGQSSQAPVHCPQNPDTVAKGPSSF